MHVIISKL